MCNHCFECLNYFFRIHVFKENWIPCSGIENIRKLKKTFF